MRTLPRSWKRSGGGILKAAARGAFAGEGRGPAHLEILGVHVQLLAVQLAQLGEGLLDVVQVLDGLSEGGQHLLPVGPDLGVATDGAGAGEVPEVGEEPLGPGIHHHHPVGREREREEGEQMGTGVPAGPALSRPPAPPGALTSRGWPRRLRARPPWPKGR
uniref:Uncharacterized protein n=1 Tax=Naja naja TaxID=35670 RepID=A0A8C6XZZ1_NAJNA